MGAKVGTRMIEVIREFVSVAAKEIGKGQSGQLWGGSNLTPVFVMDAPPHPNRLRGSALRMWKGRVLRRQALCAQLDRAGAAFAGDGRFQLLQLDEIVGLAAQLVGRPWAVGCG